MRLRAIALLLALAAAPAARAAGRLAVDPASAPVDAPVWVCAEGAAAPALLRVDGMEAPGPGAAAAAAGGDRPRPVHLVLRWPEGGSLALLSALGERPRRDALSFWGGRGRLGPGEYVLSAPGFAPETLRVREGDAAERRSRAVLARARLRAEAGDSVLAARLVERLLELEPGGAYETAAFLALGSLLPHSSYRRRPEDWLAEWVARRHSHCSVGTGIDTWLAAVPEPRASGALRRFTARYPDTRASRAAARRLARPAPGER